jgi:hypothetical protein
MRLWLGTTAVILLVGGTAAAIKLRQEDVRRIEQETGKSADDLTEEELLAAMEKLGIRRLELTDDDAYLVEMTEKQGVLPASCGGCGAPLNPNEVRWHDTHTAECPYCGTMVKTTS